MLYSEEKPRTPRKTNEVPSLSMSPQVLSMASPAFTASPASTAPCTASAATTTVPFMGPPSSTAPSIAQSMAQSKAPPASTAESTLNTSIIQSKFQHEIKQYKFS
ncbi:hypothetical protein ILYODFUR_024015 [Ilyodon furcidens]|uniref:Uncharacterized protein n=1 Tax=Ilyodon furcidens TaxID=33524 RepID=A0ABV0TCH8_9TELE